MISTYNVIVSLLAMTSLTVGLSCWHLSWHLNKCKKIFDLYRDQIAYLRNTLELSEKRQELLQLKLEWYQLAYGDIPSTGSPPQKEETSSPQ